VDIDRAPAVPSFDDKASHGENSNQAITIEEKKSEGGAVIELENYAAA